MAGSGVSGRRDGSPYGGFDHKFVEAVDDFTCSICTKVLRDPHLTVCCGQHYCSSCLDHWAKTQAKPTRCLYCRQTTDFRHFLDKKMERKIKSLHVLCVHGEDGCQWKGELRNVENHLERGCSYVQVDCSNKCGVLVRRKDMQQHMKKECLLRTYRCEHCGNEGKYKDITTRHYAECSNYPLPCPKGCPAVVKRADLKAHKNECPLEEVVCPYSEAGCDVTVLRRDIDNHLKQNCNQHLMMIVHPFLQLKDKFEALHVSVIEIATKLLASEKEMCQRLANTNARVDGMGSKLDKTSARMEETSARVEETSARVEETSARVEETSARVEETSARVEETDAWMEEADAWMEETDTWVEKTSAEIDETNVRVKSTNARLDETNARVKRTNSRVDETNTVMEETNARVKRTNSRLDETNVKVKRTNVRVDDLRRCMNEISSKLEVFETDMRRMQWKLATRVEEIDTRVVETSDETNTRVDETNTKVDETNATVDELQKSVSELSTKLVSYKGDMQWELAKTKVRENDTNTRVDETNAALDELQKSVSELSTKLVSYKGDMQWELAKTKVRENDTITRVDATNAALDELQKNVNELSTKLVSYEGDMQWELAKAKVRVNDTNIRVDEAIARVDETIAKIQKRISEMSLELASSDRIMYQRLVNTNARLTERLDETNTQLEKVQSSIVCHNWVLCIIIIMVIVLFIGLGSAIETFNKKTEL